MRRWVAPPAHLPAGRDLSALGANTRNPSSVSPGLPLPPAGPLPGGSSQRYLLDWDLSPPKKRSWAATEPLGAQSRPCEDRGQARERLLPSRTSMVASKWEVLEETGQMSHRSPRRNPPCRPLGLGLLASRTVRQCTPIV